MYIAKINWKDPRKLYWLKNALHYNWQRLFCTDRDKKIWVFGAWRGKQYDDNSRALFEYVNKYHSNKVDAIWLSDQDGIVEKVKALGYMAYNTYSDEGCKIAKKAGVAIYTHGLTDFGVNLNVGGAYIVSLWHGVGFKKIYNDRYSQRQLFFKKLMDRVFTWTQRDLTITTSHYICRQFSGIFGLNKDDKIVICGQPRNDFFKKNLNKKDLLRNIPIDHQKQFVLYMPTYRGKEVGENAMEDIVRKLYNSQSLRHVLDVTNSVFIVKLHPKTPYFNIGIRNDFVVLRYDQVESNQELLAVADMLVTDYSSCCVDYALLHRPIIFYQPDEENFVMHSEPLYEELIDILHINRATDIKGLGERICHPSLEVVDRMNSIFEDESISGTCYSDNVYRAIIKEIGI